MNAVKSILMMAIILSALSFSSCVSAKKYKEANNEKSKLQSQLSEQARLKKEHDEMSAKLKKTEEELSKLQKIVDENDKVINRLIENLAKELSGYDNNEIKVEVRSGKAYIIMSNKLLYKTGSPALDEKGISALKKVAMVLKQTPDLNILVEGHTDNVPINNKDFKDNWDLSVARASNVVRVMAANGVKPERITAAGRGEYEPAGSNQTEQGRMQNRRTEIIIAPKLTELYNLLSTRNK